MTNPCGLLISAQGTDFNRAECLRHVKAADYTTVSVLDDLTLTVDLAKQGVQYAVFRSYPFEPQPNGNDQAAGHEAADIAFGQLVGWRNTHPGSENVLFMVNCERGFGIGVSWMYAHLIERCATEVNSPIGLCVGNWSSGAVKCGQAGEPNAWIDAAEPLLRALDKHKDKRLPNGSKAFVIGNHDYTSLFAWIASNGGEYEQKPRWEDRPLAIDWSKSQWHLGRMAQGIMAACKHFGITDYPPVIITECLFDAMNDVIDRLGVLKLAPGYTKPRGWRSLVPQWNIWYPGRDPAEVLADMHIWTWETIYEPLGFVIGTHTYLYERTDDPDWISFQVDEPDGTAYRARMEAYRPGVVTPPPVVIPPIITPPPPPAPTPTGPVPNAQGQYDLLPFLRGSGVPHLTKNNWSGDEVMWTEVIDDRLWLQRKNDHSEEFGLTATHIVRGLDTSPGGGWAYVLTNLDDSQGSPWSPRWMKPGDMFYREAVVKFFRLTDGSPGPSYVDKSYLKFIKFHPTWTSWAGLTIANMAEFEVYADNKGVPSIVWERYAYAHGLGLVGWQGGDEMKKMMGIAAHDGNLSQKPRMKLGWYGGLTLPPVEPPPAPPPLVIKADDPRWERYTALAVGNVVSNIRALPTKQSAIVDTLEVGITTNIWHIPLDKLTDVEKVYSHDVAFRWWAVMLVDRVGWIRADVVTLKPAVDPPIVIPPTPPVDTTPVPNALLLQWREEFGKRALQWEDIERGAHQQAALNRGYIAEIDQLLEVQEAA